MRPPAPRIPGNLRSALQPFATLDVLTGADVAVAASLTGPDTDDTVIQAIAMVCIVRRLGHTCLELANARDRLGSAAAVAARARDASEQVDVSGVRLPDTGDWIETLRHSALVEVATGAELDLERPLVLDPEAGLVWLARYASYEQDLARRLVKRAGDSSTDVSPDRADSALTTVVAQTTGEGGMPISDEQRAAIVAALTRPVTFLVGGPGTGKTSTLGHLVAAARLVGFADGDIALAAPTGKAAERMTSSIGRASGDGPRLVARTIHSLLGLYPGATPTPGERSIAARLVVVDEASMIDLPTMTRVVAAVRDDAHLVFVGDPDQLASVDVGSVLADVVAAAARPGAPLHGSVTRLTRVFRQDSDSAIVDLATAIRAVGRDQGRVDDDAEVVANLLGVGFGSGDDATLDPGPGPGPGLGFVRRTAHGDSPAELALFDTVMDQTRRMVAAAAGTGGVGGAAPGGPAAALVAANACKVLAATRRGPGGVADWSDRLRRASGFAEHEWRAGRPILITRNDPANGLANGDTGVTVADPGAGGELRVAFEGRPPLIPSALGDFEDWWAMTIHKSQGSEYDHVVVSLPRAGSPLLTRELIYTAVTRARERVTIVGDPQVLRAALGKPNERASGLADRLR